MTFEDFKALCLALPSSSWDFPFDDETAVFRVGGRIFALSARSGRPLKANLKGDPALNRDLRSSYPEIVPGWHMNKEHWNTVLLEGSLAPDFIAGLVRHSYDCVRQKLPKSARLGLGAEGGAPPSLQPPRGRPAPAGSSASPPGDPGASVG